MNRPRYFLAATALLALAACSADYTEAESPKELRVDSAATQVNVAFVPGSAQLAPGEAARLQRLALTGSISAPDRVTIAAAGDPLLRDERIAAISRELVRYGIVVAASPLGGAPRDRAVIAVGRYMVTLPPCPNWSQESSSDFSNAKSSNFGCAVATNLGLMVASPADLAGGRELAHADGIPAVSSVIRYQTDKVKLPATTTGAAALAGPSATGGAPAAGSPTPTPGQ